MRRLLLPAVLLSLTVVLAGCGPAQKLKEFGSAVTQTIVNPLGPTDIYRVKNAYAAGLSLAADYRAYCWSKPYAKILQDPAMRAVCADRRNRVRIVKEADNKAFAAIRAAEKFIRQNPSGNAISYVSAAWDAVQEFRSTIPAVR